jgi:hypothetical protein
VLHTTFDWNRYRSQAVENRKAAERLAEWAVPVVEGITRSLQRTIVDLGRSFDPTGRSHAGLAVFLQMVGRAGVWSLDCLLGCQTVLAWLALRPGLEAALIIGKLRDDPTNAGIWRSRRTSKDARNEYRSTFSGRALISSALPRSTELQRVLSCLNDYFVHANPEYVASQTNLADIGVGVRLSIDFLDGDPESFETNLLAIVHLQSVLHESLSLCIRRGLGIVSPGLYYDPREILKGKETRVAALAGSSPTAATTLRDLGLWNVQPAVR